MILVSFVICTIGLITGPCLDFVPHPRHEIVAILFRPACAAQDRGVMAKRIDHGRHCHARHDAAVFFSAAGVASAETGIPIPTDMEILRHLLVKVCGRQHIFIYTYIHGPGTLSSALVLLLWI